MPLSQLDVIIRVAGATLLLAALFVEQTRRGNAWRFFVPLSFCLCGFLAGNTVDPTLRLAGVVAGPAAVVAGYAVPFLWWFCLAVFDDGFVPRGPVLGVGLLWLLLASADRGLFADALADRGLSWLLIGLATAMVVHLVWRLLADREGDLVDARRGMRQATVLILAGQLLLDVAVDVVMGMDWQAPWFVILQNLGVLATMIWLLRIAPLASRTAQAGRSVNITTPPVPAAEVATDTDAGLLERLRVLMEHDRIHLNPALTFAQFVQAMGAPERHVRRLVNERLGHEHFRSFLNVYRVAEARRLLADPARRGDKLLAIAFASGFSSLPTFNRVFRDIEGRPPSALRQELSNDGRVLSNAALGSEERA